MADQEEIFYRPFAEGDFDGVATVCGRTWYDEVEGVYDRTIFGRIMTSGSLKRSKYANVATTGSRIVGACFGGVQINSAAQEDEYWKAKFNEVMVPARKRAKLGGPDVEDQLFSRLRMYAMADSFIARGYANAEAELNLLVVDPAWAGRGIGTRLFDDMVENFDREGAHGFFYIASEDYNHSWFKRRGLTQVQERRVGSGRDMRSIFIFGKRIRSTEEE